MSLSTEMLIEVAQSHGDSHVRPLEVELINLKRQIMTDKQILQEQTVALSGKVEQLRPLSVSNFYTISMVVLFILNILIFKSVAIFFVSSLCLSCCDSLIELLL